MAYFPLGFWKVLEVQFSKSKHLVLQHVLAVLRLQSMIAECHPLDRRFLFVRRRRHLVTVTRCQCPIRCIWWAKMERNGTERRLCGFDGTTTDWWIAIKLRQIANTGAYPEGLTMETGDFVVDYFEFVCSVLVEEIFGVLLKKNFQGNTGSGSFL